MIRVLIVSEIRLFRQGLAEVLTVDGRLEVAHVASSVRAAIGVTPDLEMGVTLLDTATDKVQASIRALRRYFPQSKVIALAVSNENNSILEYAEAGIAGYILREDSLDCLVKVVERAVIGEFRCPNRVASALLERVSALAMQGYSGEEVPRLTARELEVARLVGNGLTNKEIAAHLHIKIPTAKNHVHNIFEKLRVHHRGEASAKLREAGVLR